jgi:hypothetical protein
MWPEACPRVATSVARRWSPIEGRVGRLWAGHSCAKRHDLRLGRRSTVPGFRQVFKRPAGPPRADPDVYTPAEPR